MQSISIVMHAHNAAMHLERSLPLVLQQDYPVFEVLVVVDNCTDLTVERLEQMEVRWPCLRHIVVPSSSWHPDRHRLSMSLGAKSARYDWIMVLQPDFAPSSMLWLRQMASGIHDGTEQVTAFCGFDASEAGSRKAQFLSTFEQRLCLPFHLLGADDSNVLVRRDALLAGHHGTTVTMLQPATSVRRVIPYGDLWWQHYVRSLRKSVRQRRWHLRWLHALAVWWPLTALAACITISLTTWWWLGAGIYLTYIIASTCLFNHFARRVGEKPFYLSLWWHSLTLPLVMWR